MSEPRDLHTIGQRIKALRKAHHMSQEELGRLVGYTKSAISEWETNRKVIGLEPLQRIAEVFRKNVAYFLGAPDDTSRSALLAELRRPLMDVLPVKSIPIIQGWDAAQSWHSANQEGIHFVIRELTADFAVVVSEESMTGVNIKPGDLVICADITPRDGDVVVIRREERILVRFLLREDGRWILRATHPAYPDITVESLEAVDAVVVRVDGESPRYADVDVDTPGPQLDISDLEVDERYVVKTLIQKFRQARKTEG